MARQARIDLPGIAQHIIQRGNNHSDCFFANDDRDRYLEWLRLAAEEYGGTVHAYVLMTNHVHLLATGKKKAALGCMMQSLGRRYVRYVNTRYRRTGTLWEGRYRASPIESDRYVLACYRYIELNPVRAGLVALPNEYRWSSFPSNAKGLHDDLITPHASYQALGRSSGERASTYCRLFRGALDRKDVEAIRNHVNQGKVLGSEGFRRRIESALRRRVRLTNQGRPAKKVL